jgi:hypothetical protein
VDELRLEPVPSGAINDTLAARIHDPLWFLARQWQLGEFQGDDAGSPRLLEIGGTSHPIAAYALGDGPWQPFDPRASPLDPVVETIPDAPDVRLTVEAGAHFVRLLRASGLQRYRDVAVTELGFATLDPFVPDPLLAACAAAVPDAERLAADLDAFVDGRESRFQVEAEDQSTATAVAKEWLAWYAAERGPTSSGAGDAWDPHRLEHRIRVASDAGGGVVFRAGDYAGESLDWCEFDLVDDAEVPALSGAPAREVRVRATPTPVTFGGMPAPRYWELEDARFDFGNVDAAGHDLGRLLLVQFTMVFGNDWFLVPVPLEVGTVTLLDRVILTDVFGRRFSMSRAGKDEPQWNLFSHEATSGGPHPAEGALFLPPVIGTPLTSEPSELVHLMRDEMANLAWAIERYVESPLGDRIDRHTAWRSKRHEPATVAGETPRYIVETEVPDYWIPLQPEQLADRRSIQLVVSPLIVPTASGDGFEAANPIGALLQAPDGGSLWLYEEEVPRAGVTVERLAKYGRWHDGRVHMWKARRKRGGRGEGSSGLRFDVVLPE